MTLNEKIQTRFIGTKWLGENKMCAELGKFIGCEMMMYDHYIDDGADEDEEDEYIMCGSFESKDGSVNGRVQIYYGDITEEIGYVKSEIEEV